jgi:peptide/nickel transport system substrate-binding protein
LKGAAVLSGGALLAACAPAATPAPAEPTAKPEEPTEAPEPTAAPTEEPMEEGIKEVPREKTLVLGWWGSAELQDWNIMTPFAIGGGYQQGTNIVYEGMAYWNAFRDETIMWQAESYAYNDDFTELTINLRPEVEWSDGTPFTSEDVVYTISHLKDIAPDVRHSGEIAALTEDVVAVDAQTVLITMTQPSPRYFWRFFNWKWDSGAFPIMPKHIFEGEDWSSFTHFDIDKGWPVTTAPIQLVFSSPQQKIWDRRDDWWAVKAGISDGIAMERVINVAAGTDATILTELMVSNEIDITHLGPDSAKVAIEQNPKITTHYGHQPPYGYVDWFSQAMYLNSEVEERFGNPDVRWALSYYIDRQTLVDVAWDGVAPVSKMPWPPYAGLVKYEEAISDLLETWDTNEHNPEKGDALMEKAGFTKNGDGMWVDADGETLKVPMEANGPQWNATGQVLVEMLQRNGIDAEYNQTPESRQKFFAADYTAHVWGHTGSLKEPFATCEMYTCAGEIKAGEFQRQLYAGNLSKWCNPDFDEIVVQMAVTDPEDFDTMSALTHDAMEIWLPELPTIQLFEWLHNFGMNTTYWVNWPTSESEDGEYCNEASQLLAFNLVLDHLKPAQ